MVKHLPVHTRPRERLLLYGAHVLSDIELLAILLHTGSKTQHALQLAESILSYHSLPQLPNTNLQTIKGVGKAKVCSILAACELARRIQAPVQQKAITSPQHAYEHVKHFFVRQDQEQFIAVFLNTKKVPIHTHLIGIGTLDHITLHPRDILAKALACKASSLLLAHNHPSGDCEPSEEDITFTHQFVKLATFMGFEVCDHIIVGQHTFCSFMDKGLLE